MKISGAYTMAVSPERAFALLQNPQVLARAMPGCESLDLIGPDEYAMRMKMVLASMSGLFEGKVRIADSHPPVSFRLIVEGQGKIGFMKGDGLLTLTQPDPPAADPPAEPVAAAPQCQIKYEGEVHVGGTIAAVGQRLLDTTSRLLIKRFFEKLSSEAASVSHFVA